MLSSLQFNKFSSVVSFHDATMLSVTAELFATYVFKTNAIPTKFKFSFRTII